MIRLLMIFIGVTTMSLVNAQSFEGFVEFTKTEGSIMTFYRYYVKGSNIRVEEINVDGEVEGIMLIDVVNGKQLALNPRRNVYMEIPSKRKKPSAEVQIKKTLEMKLIKGELCTLWTAQSEDLDRKVEYWVAEGNYDFFIPMLNTLKRKDNQAVFFTEIQGAEGVFPMLGEETKLEDGTFVSKLEVTKMKKASIGDDLFAIPPEYNRFEN